MKLNDNNRPIVVWSIIGLVAFCVLPWYALPEGLSGLQSIGELFAGHDSSSALAQILLHRRPWLAVGVWPLVVALVSLRMTPGVAQGRLLAWCSALGVAGMLLQGFAIGLPATSVIHGASQPGFGWGAMLVLCSLLMLAAFGMARTGAFRGDLFVAAAVLGASSLLVTFVAFPVFRSLSGAFLDDSGHPSVAAWLARIASERIWGIGCAYSAQSCGVAWNTLALATLTGLTTTVLGTLLALIENRSDSRIRNALRFLAPLPIITPPFVVGLGLILLFGRAGIVNQLIEWAFGVEPTRWFYGWFGVWLAQLFAFTPIAFLIVRGVIEGISPSLEEASQTLRAGGWRTFLYVTFPLMLPGLTNAFLVGFIESIADFGNPIVVGGQFSVLSTEIFFAIVGAQFDQGRAAALALILTVFALGVFALQRRVLGRKNFTTVSGKGDAGLAMRLPDGLRRAALCVVVPWLIFTLVVYVFAFCGGFVQTWGRNYSPTLAHFRTAFEVAIEGGAVQWIGVAWDSLFTTVRLAAIAAPLTAAMGLLIAWLLARVQFRAQGVFEFSALMAFAIPGTVLGVSYVLVFNVPPLEMTGTGLIIVMCFIFRNLPVGVRAGAAAFKQLDKSLDEASLMLRASTARTLWSVTLPLLKPALAASLIYSFVRSMTTVSAVIFLVTAETELATTFIIGRVGQGDYGVALAYSTVLIVLMALVTGLVQWRVGNRRLGRRASAAATPAGASDVHRSPAATASP
ncbi:ABC-type Fe3+ transport system, permease component [Variovorax sp. CF313]|uniref:ABC transporter permease n=1 Tax=Variovorax sp. CF313 TaxID=1144315 RepID=UPI000270E418|nr:iron ABC transporter permease [Variovorax sp. CF313]EJL77448.1 ABC-type Fe3+ transport system, permease component [Variovorax sp. CF313]